MTQAIIHNIGFQNTYLIPSAVFQAVRQRVVDQLGMEDDVDVKPLKMRGVKVFEGHKKHLGFIALAAFFVFPPTDGDDSSKECARILNEERARILKEMLQVHLKTEQTVEGHELAVVLGFAALCKAEYPKENTAKEKILKLLLKAYPLYQPTPPADDSAFMRQSDSSETTGPSESAYSDTGTSDGTRTPTDEELPTGDARDLASPHKGTPAPNHRSTQVRPDLSNTDDGSPVLGVSRRLSFSDDEGEAQDRTQLPLPQITGSYTGANSAALECMAKAMLALLPSKVEVPDIDMDIDESPLIDQCDSLITEIQNNLRLLNRLSPGLKEGERPLITTQLNEVVALSLIVKEIAKTQPVSQ